MKNFHFNLQAKGGVGKSMLTYLQSLKYELNNNTLFIDLDSSVSSSRQQLKFLQGKKPMRFGAIKLLDSNEKIDRQLLFENLLQLSQKAYEDIYLDFGAPESDQLPSLFSKDYTTSDFKQIEEELNAKFIFNIVIAGGGAYEACTNYLHKLVTLINGHFEINICVNQSTFSNHSHLIDELISYAVVKQNKINAVKLFGDFDITTSPHKNILSYIEKGRGMEAYQFIEKIKILKELDKI